jgi:hypothetical protein
MAPPFGRVEIGNNPRRNPASLFVPGVLEKWRTLKRCGPRTKLP